MLKGFEQYLLNEGRSINTVKNYTWHANCFIIWHIGSFGSKPQGLQRIAILDYISYLRSVKNAAPRTINTKIHALIKLNHYLVAKGLQDNMVVGSRDKADQKDGFEDTGVITKEAVEDLMNEILHRESYRDYALATVLAYAGLRVSEALDLRLRDVSFEERVLMVGGGEKKKKRKVPVDERVMEVLGYYINGNKKLVDSSQYVFGSRQGDRLCRTRVNQIFNKHSDCITPEKLRRFHKTYVSMDPDSTG
jgi:integrase/recombinase XerD